ncbi:hypothetical protein LRH25_00810 [Ideonella azotifigens]|uniref:hypothetical protein n=1 Tax=Ideonella azotifigens TaxID=513160 RepID=UPI0014771BB5|nr:hypothetical protein [Ideonella azotifigens]MCD2338878.1 hypothetical protein [Ideonella azotifigens]
MTTGLRAAAWTGGGKMAFGAFDEINPRSGRHCGCDAMRGVGHGVAGREHSASAPPTFAMQGKYVLGFAAAHERAHFLPFNV